MVDYDKLSTLLCFINDSDASSQYHRRVVEYKFIAHVFFNSMLGCPRDFFLFLFFFFFEATSLLYSYSTVKLIELQDFKTISVGLPWWSSG